MFVLLTYDIGDGNSSKETSKRLNKLSRLCLKFGARVQNSVFEMDISFSDYIKLKNEIQEIIEENDSVRIYKLGKNYKNNIELLGRPSQFEIIDDNSFIL